jgi:hypothetical protein
MVPWRDLGAVVGRATDSIASMTLTSVLHHEAVVEAVRGRGPALPVRFGTVFRDEMSLASALAERYQAITADLDRLGDKVEVGLTALWAVPTSGEERAPWVREESAAASQNAGARYLQARAAELRRDEALRERARTVAGTLNQVLGVRALEQRQSLAPTPGIAVRASYLLDPDDVGEFRAAFDAMRLDRRDLRLVLTGPWPPYSFVRQSETECAPVADARFADLAQILTNPASLLSRCGARVAN